MTFYFRSIASGSSGNSYLIGAGDTALLVDAGISGKRILEGIESAGTDPMMVEALLITHEHSDHIKSIGVLHKKIPHLLTYSNAGTWRQISKKIPDDHHILIATGESFNIGPIEVRSIRTSHDAAEPVCYSFRCEGRQASIVTDTGYITDEIYDEIKTADLLALEANHDVNVLEMCSYPYHIKRRIIGDKGHLSNEAAAEGIARLVKNDSRRRRILLAHLSQTNNSPEMAVLTVRNFLEEEGVFLGDETVIDVLLRDEPSAVYQV